MVDADSREPLTASETLDVLERTRALEKLQAQGYQATGFDRAAEEPESEDCKIYSNFYDHISFLSTFELFEC